MDKAIVDRFWSKVNRGSPDECWEWQGGMFNTGYGAFCANYGTFGAHRVAWEIANGHPPGEAWVCHSCDNKRCVNPAHLWLGNSKSNHDDMANKGRRGRPAPRGENNVHHRLTPDQVRDIRAALASGSKILPLARKYGVNRSSIDSIAKGTSWSWLT